MTFVAIHQPNYAPWLGYFHKMARADIFVFLDDAQFSKGSYINRVQIARGGSAVWLTQPVSVSLGTAIRDVEIAREDWAATHLDMLSRAYGRAPAFEVVFPDIAKTYAAMPGRRLAEVNRYLVQYVAEKLGIETRTILASQTDTSDLSGDGRLVSIVDQVAPGGTYLSGKGGGTYQDPAKFEAAGLALEYTQFEHPTYERSGETFIAGLSVLDAVFHIGWKGAARLVAP